LAGGANLKVEARGADHREMSLADHPPALTGLGLIAVGATSTAVGGLGVGFRAAGLGYLGQSLGALTIGLVMLTVGLRIAARTRRDVFASFRTAHVAPAFVRSAAPTPQPVVRYARPAPFAPDPRVRVHAWVGPQLELPPARAAA